MSNGNGELMVQEKPLQTRETFRAVRDTPLGHVQVADELGFAYLDQDIDFGAIGKNEIFQNIKFILLTEYYSVPLDREFGFDYSMIDKPIPIAEAVLSQEVAMKIALYEPRAEFREIHFVREILIGKLSPSVKVALLTTNELPSLYRPVGTAAIAPVTKATIAGGAAFPGSITGVPGKPGPMGPVGPAGPTGTNWQGEYDPIEKYEINDAVSYGGSSYICVEETLGNTPAPDTVSNLIPPLANSGSRGAIAALAPSGQTGLWARGDNTWQPLPIYVPPVGAVVQSNFIERQDEVSTTIQWSQFPTITQGLEIFSLTVTPLYSTSKLILSLVGFFDVFTNKPSVTASGTLSFFMDSTWLFSNYLMSAVVNISYITASARCEAIPGAGAKTYSVRMTSANHPTYITSVYMNGYGWNTPGTPATDYKNRTSFRIEEIKQ